MNHPGVSFQANENFHEDSVMGEISECAKLFTSRIFHTFCDFFSKYRECLNGLMTGKLMTDRAHDVDPRV